MRLAKVGQIRPHGVRAEETREHGSGDYMSHRGAYLADILKDSTLGESGQAGRAHGSLILITTWAAFVSDAFGAVALNMCWAEATSLHDTRSSARFQKFIHSVCRHYSQALCYNTACSWAIVVDNTTELPSTNRFGQRSTPSVSPWWRELGASGGGSVSEVRDESSYATPGPRWRLGGQDLPAGQSLSSKGGQLDVHLGGSSRCQHEIALPGRLW